MSSRRRIWAGPTVRRRSGLARLAVERAPGFRPTGSSLWVRTRPTGWSSWILNARPCSSFRPERGSRSRSRQEASAIHARWGSLPTGRRSISRAMSAGMEFASGSRTWPAATVARSLRRVSTGQHFRMTVGSLLPSVRVGTGTSTRLRGARCERSSGWRRAKSLSSGPRMASPFTCAAPTSRGRAIVLSPPASIASTPGTDTGNCGRRFCRSPHPQAAPSGLSALRRTGRSASTTTTAPPPSSSWWTASGDRRLREEIDSKVASMAAKPRFAGSFLLFWPALLLCGAAVAQTTGRIEGVARGESAAALPGVTVEVTGVRLQGVRNTVTDSAGRYRFPELPPGPYRVRATLTAFLPEEKSVTLALDEALSLDFELKLAVSESVNVAGEVGLVDVSSTTTGTTYTDKVVEKLTVDGTTSAENQWIIDGINTTNVLTGVQGKALNTEFVEEVEVKIGGYQADYGRALGGIINIITKSGGNAFHGDAFAYYDSEATRARQGSTNVTSTSAKITPDRRWDYGVDIGGYFVKDRLWFFAAYDRVETPGTASRYQDFKDRFGVVVVPSSFQVPRDQTDQLWSGKLTWNIAAGSTLVATAFSDPTEISGAAQVGTSSARVGGQIQSPDPGTWESRREIGGTDYGLRFSQLLGSSGVVSLQGSRHRDRFELFPSSAAEAVRLEDRQCNGGTPLQAC